MLLVASLERLTKKSYHAPLDTGAQTAPRRQKRSARMAIIGLRLILARLGKLVLCCDFRLVCSRRTCSFARVAVFLVFTVWLRSQPWHGPCLLLWAVQWSRNVHRGVFQLDLFVRNEL